MAGDLHRELKGHHTMAKQRATAGGRTTPKADIEDRFDPQENGTIKAAFNGVEYHLRRPKLGEVREFVERLGEMAAAQDANRALPDDDRDRELSERLFVGWWREVITTLDRLGHDFPEDDADAPPWLISSNLVQETRNHWSSVPWGPGGSPTQRAATALGPLLGQIGPLLGVAAAADAGNANNAPS